MDKNNGQFWLRALTAAVISAALIYYDRRQRAGGPGSAAVEHASGGRGSQLVEGLLRNAATQIVEESKPVLKEGIAQAEKLSREWFKQADRWVDHLQVSA